MLQRALEEEALREREKLERAHTKLARAQAEQANQKALQEADALRNLRTMHHDIRMEQVYSYKCSTGVLDLWWVWHIPHTITCISCRILV